MWLDASRTRDGVPPHAPAGSDNRHPDDDRAGDLPHLRDLIETLPMPLLAKCRLLQLMAAPDRGAFSLSQLDRSWQLHRERHDGSDHADEEGALQACTLAYRTAVLGREGDRPDLAASALFWRAASARATLSEEARDTVADAIIRSGEDAVKGARETLA